MHALSRDTDDKSAAETAPRPVGLRDIIFFLRFGKARWTWAALGICLTMVASGAGALIPLGGKALIDYAVLKSGLSQVDRLLRAWGLAAAVPAATRVLGSADLIVLAVMLLGVATAAAAMLQKYVLFRFQQDVARTVETALFDHVLRFPLSFFRRQQTGYLMSRVRDDVQVVQYIFSEGVAHALWRALFLVFGLLFVFAINRALALVSLVLLPAAFLITRSLGRRLLKVSTAERERGAEVSREVQEVLSGVETVKAHTAEERQVDRFSERLGSALAMRLRAFVLSLLSGFSVSGFQFGYTLTVMWFGSHEILAGRMTVGDYVALTSYAVYFAGSVNSVVAFYMALQPALASLGRIMELFSLTPETADLSPASGEVPPMTGAVSFDHVSFSYDDGEPVLSDITFSVLPGQIAVIEGLSGAGKTTIVNLLLKFYEPLSGVVLIDGRDIRHVSARWLRDGIGVVSQDIFLFNDTIADNIRYSRPGASDAEVEEAARLANIHEDIMGFERGYRTVVGERGLQLSAGQRQRVSIARAFLREPAILILDEPTSALDAETEARVAASVSALAKGRTTFVITHRPALTRIADRIFVLEGGHIRELPPPA